MRMMKKLVSSILSMALVISMFYGFSMPSVKAASSGTCGDNLTWVLDDEGTLTISGTGDMDDFWSSDAPWYSSRSSIKTVVIENGVMSIGDWAFSGYGLTSVTIGNGVKRIGRAAFDSTALTSVTIPDSVMSIGEAAFGQCLMLESVTIGNGVKSIGDHAFEECSSLTSVTIGNSVTSIGDYAFEGCISLPSVTIPGSVTSIGDFAFCSCEGLTNMIISDGVKSIGEGAFEYCISLLSVEIPDSVTSIGTYAFWVCSSLVDVTIGNGVESIGVGAFSESLSLKNVTIGNGVKSIGAGAFWSCGLVDVTIGHGVTSIGTDAFGACDRLTDVYYAGTKKDRANISIESNNEPLEYATWHYALTYTLPSLANTAKGIKVTFSKVEGATHYQICRRLKASDKGDAVESNFSVVKTIADSINNSSKINYYDAGTAIGKNGNTYVYYIRPVVMKNDTIKISGPTKNVQIRRISTPAIKSCVNSAARTVTIKWSKNSLATGYDVWYSDGTSKNQIRIKNKNTVSRVVKGLKKGKTYTFKVRAIYITAAGVVYKSAWKPAEVKITK